jgi:hypothetical protein
MHCAQMNALWWRGRVRFIWRIDLDLCPTIQYTPRTIALHTKYNELAENTQTFGCCASKYSRRKREEYNNCTICTLKGMGHEIEYKILTKNGYFSV